MSDGGGRGGEKVRNGRGRSRTGVYGMVFIVHRSFRSLFNFALAQDDDMVDFVFYMPCVELVSELLERARQLV